MDNQDTTIIQTAGGLEVDDIITFSGQYKKRTFWQRITRKPKQLETFTVKHVNVGGEALIGLI